MTASQPRSIPTQDTQGRILLVEDEPTNMAILAAYLRVAGYEVKEASDGAAGWAILSSDSDFDLLVTDRRMPGMDGLELAMRVRNDRRVRHIPVIMQTGATSQEEILEGIRAGVYYYLAKPYEEATLLSIVRSAIQDKNQKAFFERRIVQHAEALNSLLNADFSIRTPEEAQNVALLIGSAYSRPELVVTGLYELFLNAIEHGNLGIGYDAKNKLLSAGTWQKEIVRRLALAENVQKRVKISFKRSERDIEVTVQDEGPGFDWRPFIEIEPSRATFGNGRGIAKAALLAFNRIEFQGSGNKVRLVSD